MTVCDTVADVDRLGKTSWINLLVENDKCMRRGSNKNDEVIKSRAFSSAPNLETLFISQRLQNIEESAFEGLHKLKYLKLWGNVLKVLPRRSFSNFSQLDKLDLQDNLIENLVHGFCEGSYIREVDLSFNKLTNLQVNMLDSPDLEKIHLSHNDIQSIAPKAFGPGLISLDLSYNSLDTLPAESFINSNSLTALILHHNKLKQLGKLPGLDALEVLDICHNQINELPEDIFENTPNVKHLYLNNNQLKRISSNALSRIDLRTIHLHNNHLTGIDHVLGQGLKRLSEMSIGGNPWHCSCLQGIMMFISDNGVVQVKCDKDFISDGKNPVCVGSQRNVNCHENHPVNEAVLERIHADYNCHKE